MQEVRRYQLVALFAALLVVVVVVFIRPKATVAPTTNTVTNQNTNTVANTNQALTLGMRFYTDDLPTSDANFSYSVRLPDGWLSKYDTTAKAIVLYDPSGSTGNQEKIWTTFYAGQEFTTPAGTVSVGPTDLQANNKSARRWTVAETTAAQDWLAQTHIVEDVKVSASGQGLFYRFTFAPEISTATIDDFFNSLDLTDTVR